MVERAGCPPKYLFGKGDGLRVLSDPPDWLIVLRSHLYSYLHVCKHEERVGNLVFEVTQAKCQSNGAQTNARVRSDHHACSFSFVQLYFTRITKYLHSHVDKLSLNI